MIDGAAPANRPSDGTVTPGIGVRVAGDTPSWVSDAGLLYLRSFDIRLPQPLTYDAVPVDVPERKSVVFSNDECRVTHHDLELQRKWDRVIEGIEERKRNWWDLNRNWFYGWDPPTGEVVWIDTQGGVHTMYPTAGSGARRQGPSRPASGMATARRGQSWPPCSTGWASTRFDSCAENSSAYHSR